MIRVTLENITAFDLPLDSTEKIVKRGDSKRILKKLEKRYGLKSHWVCRKDNGIYLLYANAAYFYIPDKLKEIWIKNYETYVRSSIQYKFWIACTKLYVWRENFVRKLK